MKNRMPWQLHLEKKEGKTEGKTEGGGEKERMLSRHL